MPTANATEDLLHERVHICIRASPSTRVLVKVPDIGLADTANFPVQARFGYILIPGLYFRKGANGRCHNARPLLEYMVRKLNLSARDKTIFRVMRRDGYAAAALNSKY